MNIHEYLIFINCIGPIRLAPNKKMKVRELNPTNYEYAIIINGYLIFINCIGPHSNSPEKEDEGKRAYPYKL